MKLNMFELSSLQLVSDMNKEQTVALSKFYHANWETCNANVKLTSKQTVSSTEKAQNSFIIQLLLETMISTLNV